MEKQVPRFPRDDNPALVIPRAEVLGLRNLLFCARDDNPALVIPRAKVLGSRNLLFCARDDNHS